MSNKEDAGADDLIEKTRTFWLGIGESLVKESVATTDEVAKQLIAVVAILEGLYFHAIVFSDLRDAAKYPVALLARQWCVYLLPIVLLLGSLICALAVFFPARYRVNMLSHEAAKIVFERIASRKLCLVRASAVFLALGVGAVLCAAYIYLRTRP